MNIDLGELNWLAVIVAALAGYALGAVYFTVAGEAVDGRGEADR